MDAAAEPTLRAQVERCIEAFHRGELTEQRLRRLLDAIDAPRARRQDLLYLQAASTSLQSTVRGMMRVCDGELDEGPADPKDWPYQSVLDAIRAGWRVIQFPDLALLLDDTRTRGLGCEFILEKWEDVG
jgi:hypothetical protein